MNRFLEKPFLESELACEKTTMYNKKNIAFSPFSSITFPILIVEYINIANPPGNKVSWRCRNDVYLYVPATSQVRLKWNIQRCLDGTSPSQDVSVVRLRDVLLERRDDVSRGPNNNVLSVRLHGLSNKSQMKHPTISQLSGTSPRRLSGTFPRRPISTSLPRLL